jgi:hypothetical protein
MERNNSGVLGTGVGMDIRTISGNKSLTTMINHNITQVRRIVQ